MLGFPLLIIIEGTGSQKSWTSVVQQTLGKEATTDYKDPPRLVYPSRVDRVVSMGMQVAVDTECSETQWK